MTKPLSTHDERQAAHRGPGPDTDVEGHGRRDPSAPVPEARDEAGFHPRGHGKGGRLGRGEPEDHPERDGSTQPNFGQAGSYGQAGGRAQATPSADGDDGDSEAKG